MNEPFRANQETLAERALHLERENASLRTEIARVRASTHLGEGRSSWPHALRIRGPFVLLGFALALQLGWYVRAFYLIETRGRLTHCEL